MDASKNTSPEISFAPRSSRREDWVVLFRGRTVGSVWRVRDGYAVSVGEQVTAPTAAEAFVTARRLVRAKLS